MTTRQQSGVKIETHFGRMPIDRPTVRDAARRELRSTGAAVADNLPAAILERLAANEPVTSPLLFFAVRSIEAPLSSSVERRVELPLAAEIDAAFQAEVAEFSARFFELEPERRRDVWMALRRRTSASPALTARLEDLSRGLEIDCRALADETPAVQRLAALVREFFVLPPLERAARRREWLAAHEAEAKTLRQAGWHLAWSFPQTAQLDQVFLQKLRSPDRPRRWWNRVRIDPQTAKQHPLDRFIAARPKTSLAFLAACVTFGVTVAVINERPKTQYRVIQPTPEAPPRDYRFPSRRPPKRGPKQLPQSPRSQPTTKKPGVGL